MQLTWKWRTCSWRERQNESRNIVKELHKKTKEHWQWFLAKDINVCNDLSWDYRKWPKIYCPKMNNQRTCSSNLGFFILYTVKIVATTTIRIRKHLYKSTSGLSSANSRDCTSWWMYWTCSENRSIYVTVQTGLWHTVTVTYKIWDWVHKLIQGKSLTTFQGLSRTLLWNFKDFYW